MREVEMDESHLVQLCLFGTDLVTLYYVTLVKNVLASAFPVFYVYKKVKE